MYKGWTNFNRVLMGISMGVCFVLIVVVASILRDNWWIPVVIGIPVVFAAHCIWGLFVEMSKNIIRIGSMQMVPAANQSANAVPVNGQNDYSAPVSGQPGVNAPVYSENIPQDWTCPMCMTKNSKINNFCEKCGNPRNNSMGGN